MTEQAVVSDRRLALGLTISCHALLVLFLLFFILRTPIPPYPDLGGGSGLEVNFGNSAQGFGNNKSYQLIPLDLQEVSASKNDNFLTHNLGEASNINGNNNNLINISAPVVDNSKTYHRPKSMNDQGIEGKQGNQGNENGDVNSNNYKGKGGKGNDPDGGKDVGIKGPGYLCDIAGRKINMLVKPDYESDEQGKIVVTITVDQNGTVTKAFAGAIGTTISNQVMQKQAEKAALKSKFNAKSDAAVEQQGTITYIYRKLN